MNEQNLINSVELAKRLDVAPDTINRWRRDGVIPSILINEKTIRYDVDDVINSLKNKSKTNIGVCDE